MIFEKAIDPNEDRTVQMTARSNFTVKAHNDEHLLLDNGKIISRESAKDRIVVAKVPFKKFFLKEPDRKYSASGNAGGSLDWYYGLEDLGFNYYRVWTENGCYFQGGLENCQRYMELNIKVGQIKYMAVINGCVLELKL